MSERLATMGLWLGYAVETTAGERPTSGYKRVPEVKTMPSFNPAPETIESTTFEEMEYKTYVPALKDLGGALEYGANLTNDLGDFWDEVLDAYETASAARKAMWWVMAHPSLNFALYFMGKPSPFSLNESAVSAMLETTLYITPSSGPIKADAPTEASGASEDFGL